MQDCKTPLDVATNAEVKALLREHGGKHSLLYVAGEGTLDEVAKLIEEGADCLLYTSPSPRDRQKSRMPSSA